MEEARTTAAVQHYLDDLVESPRDSPAEPIIRALLARAVERLHLLCATLLHRSYPRLARPPLNLQTVLQFFALANQHIRWELNDLARRLDEGELVIPLTDAHEVESSGSGISPN